MWSAKTHKAEAVERRGPLEASLLSVVRRDTHVARLAPRVRCERSRRAARSSVGASKHPVTMAPELDAAHAATVRLDFSDFI